MYICLIFNGFLLLLLLLLSRFSHVRLCNPIDGSPPGSPVPGILQARTLEWVAISFSNAWKWKVKVKSLSRVQLLATPRTAAYQAPPSMGFSRQEYWSGMPLPSPWSILILSSDTLGHRWVLWSHSIHIPILGSGDGQIQQCLLFWLLWWGWLTDFTSWWDS